MNDITAINIIRNPAQTVASVVKLFGFRVRGNTIYVFFSGLVFGVFAAIATYPVHILLAGVMMLLPRCFFWFYLDEKQQGRFLRKPKRKGGANVATP